MIRPGLLVKAYHNCLNYRLDHNGYMWRKCNWGFWKQLTDYPVSVYDFYFYAEHNA